MIFQLFNKIKRVLIGRPTQAMAYIRQTYLFLQTGFFIKLIFNNSKNVKIFNNVRVQALGTINVEPEAQLEINSNSIIYENAKFEVMGQGKLSIGENSIIGDARISCRSKIKIGSNFLTSWNVYISDFDPHPIDPNARQQQINSMCNSFYPNEKRDSNLPVYNWEFSSKEIQIGNNVWVGANVSVLKGAIIGNNCILATGAVVLSGVYPDNAILAGNPAKVVKIVGV